MRVTNVIEVMLLVHNISVLNETPLLATVLMYTVFEHVIDVNTYMFVDYRHAGVTSDTSRAQTLSTWVASSARSCSTIIKCSKASSKTTAGSYTTGSSYCSL